MQPEKKQCRELQMTPHVEMAIDPQEPSIRIGVLEMTRRLGIYGWRLLSPNAVTALRIEKIPGALTNKVC